MKPFRVRHFLKAIQFLFTDKKNLSTIHYAEKQNTLLIVKLDAIGDYLLFRNFLADIRSSEKYKHYRITLCGNKLWKELAEKLDSSYVDEFIWVDKKSLINNSDYRKNLLFSIKQNGFEIAFQPTFSREILTGDSIVRASCAKHRLGSLGDDANEISILKYYADSFYTSFLKNNETPLFEFLKNKSIIEELIGENISRKNPELISSSNSKKNSYAVLFPGAGEIQKQWPIEKFSEIADELQNKYNYKILICGSPDDSTLAEKIIAQCKTSSPENLCGKTSLLELIEKIASASILLTNDSVALHISACTKTKTVCVLNGRHYGRFAPYPKNIANHISYVFPEAMCNLILKSEVEAVRKTKYNAIDSINSIQTEQVKEAIIKLLE
ncbi:MAG: glycosyltransferase family 9 protein [Bacteroidota bacterium]